MTARKVRMLTDAEGGNLKAGEIISIPEAGAKHYVEIGVAEYVNEQDSNLQINREHAEFHLEILGQREEYCIVSKTDYPETEWKIAADVIKCAQSLNNRKRTCWISLNDKEHGIDKIIGVRALCDFYTDVDGRPHGTKDRLATKEEWESAYQVALKFKNYIENQYAAIGFLAYSGNGFHVHFPLPITPLIGKDYRELVNEKLKAFTHAVCDKNNITVDDLDYTRRVTTLIGSWNLKIPAQPVQTKWIFALDDDYQNRKQVIDRARQQNGEVLLKAILETEIKTKTANSTETTVKPHPKLDEILRLNPKLNAVYNGDVRAHKGDDDRSDAESYIVCSLVGYGFTDQEIEEVMLSCKLGKWQEKDDSYRTRTLERARAFIKEKRAEEQAKQSEQPPQEPDSIISVPLDQANEYTSKGYKPVKYYADKVTLVKKGEKQKNGDTGDIKESQADRLLRYCLEEKIVLFHDQHKTPYIQIQMPCGSCETCETCGIFPNITAKVDAYSLEKNRNMDKEGEKEENAESQKVVEISQISQLPQVSQSPAVQFKNEIYSLNSSSFKYWISRLMYIREGKTAGPDAVKAVINVLCSKALLEGTQYFLYNRVATSKEAFWLDLADKRNRAIKITSQSWDIVNDPPILFRRYNHQLPIITPERNNNPKNALELINLTNIDKDEETRLAFICTVISDLVPSIAHPAIVVSGPQGSAKSWLLKLVKNLLDPSSIELLSIPKDERELAQQLDHHWIVPYDNIDELPQWASDTLCKGVTGGGISVRKLYTDDEDTILTFKRPIMLNGINLAAQKGDLLDRSIPVKLVPPAKRKTEAELLAQFNSVAPKILGGFLDAIVEALKIYPTITKESLQRLADFDKYGCAIAKVLGKTQKEFDDAYADKVKEQNEEALNSDQIALLIVKFCTNFVKGKVFADMLGQTQDCLELTPTDLYQRILNLAEPEQKQDKDFPKSVNALSRRINTISPALKAVGINLTSYDGTPRRIRIECQRLVTDKKETITGAQRLLELAEPKQCEKCGIKTNLTYRISTTTRKYEVCQDCGAHIEYELAKQGGA